VYMNTLSGADAQGKTRRLDKVDAAAPLSAA